ncbi:hypothetical protein K431DRAFT_213928 [Polychaeton citri CBS 116435]|uniref:CENP-S complex, centromere protein X n=1 Tax=Polychaeton citri CBS 116435 TaxID=1314669 RepID=A0A9P4QK25_9PEZI|nr:hypothetical protein K431DRAFT_213928 [Polychaeton citri CBS 116435]
MPPRKEPKETVTYPASKRKAPPFKPQRPSQTPRTSSGEINDGRAKPTQAAPTARRAIEMFIDNNEAVDDDSPLERASSEEEVIAPSSKSESEDEMLEDDPLAAVAASKQSKSKTKQALQSEPSDSPRTEQEMSSLPSQVEANDSIPRPLLARILHEHFDDPQTKIDKQAIQVLDQYLEIFMRETIARSSLQKKEDVAQGTASQSDAGWLELKDLEKVAPGMLLDF